MISKPSWWWIQKSPASPKSGSPPSYQPPGLGGQGLKNGDQVCITPIEIISEGMKVRVIGDSPPSPDVKMAKDTIDRNESK